MDNSTDIMDPELHDRLVWRTDPVGYRADRESRTAIVAGLAAEVAADPGVPVEMRLPELRLRARRALRPGTGPTQVGPAYVSSAGTFDPADLTNSELHRRLVYRLDPGGYRTNLAGRVAIVAGLAADIKADPAIPARMQLPALQVWARTALRANPTES